MRNGRVNRRKRWEERRGEERKGHEGREREGIPRVALYPRPEKCPEVWVDFIELQCVNVGVDAGMQSVYALQAAHRRMQPA